MRWPPWRRTFTPPPVPDAPPPRVWDVFPYWRERWAAEARLRLWSQLAPGVDYRPVALIGDRTHRGTPKPDGLPEPPDGVERVAVTLDAATDWARERQQRAAVRSLLPRMDPADLVLLCDADELVDPRMVPVIAAMTAEEPAKLYMMLYMCGTRWRNPNWWCHPAACRARHLPTDPSKGLRLRSRGVPGLRAAGWHLSYYGTDADINAKLAAFAHAECDTAEMRADLADIRDHGTGRVDDPLTGPLVEILTQVRDPSWRG